MNWDWANLDIFKTYSDNKENPKKKKKKTQPHKRVEHQRFMWFNIILYLRVAIKIKFYKASYIKSCKKDEPSNENS